MPVLLSVAGEGLHAPQRPATSPENRGERCHRANLINQQFEFSGIAKGVYRFMDDKQFNTFSITPQDYNSFIDSQGKIDFFTKELTVYRPHGRDPGILNIIRYSRYLRN